MRDHKEELYSNKGNEIIQSYAWDLKEKQLKIMEMLCSCYMTNYYDAEKNTITVGVADFMRELGFSTTGLSSREYKRFETAIQKLSDTSIIGIGFNGKRRIIRLINTADFPTEAGETAIVCHMSEDFKECMKLQDRGNTKIEFKTICSMDSRYSIKLYNLLRSWQGKDEVFFDLDYLKELLNITAKSYDNFGKFRQAVLDVAIDEINDKTNLRVTYEGLTPLHSRSRKITRVVFNIKNSSSVKPLDKQKTNFVSSSSQSSEVEVDEFAEDYSKNPMEITFNSAEDKENYVSGYIENQFSNDTNRLLADFIPEDVHQYSEDYIDAIQSLVRQHIPFDVLPADRALWIANTVSRFTRQEWPLKKRRVKTSAAGYYKVCIEYWLADNFREE